MTPYKQKLCVSIFKICCIRINSEVYYKTYLRGHKDYGPLELDEPIDNDGNFRALLRLRVKCGDTNLKKKHFDSLSHNSTYIY